MTLAVDLTLRQQVIVVLVRCRIGAEHRQLLVRLFGLALRQVSVRQSDADDFVGSARLLRFLEVLTGKIEVMHGQQQVGGFDQIVGSNRRRFADAALGKAKADLLLRVIFLPVAFTIRRAIASRASTRFASGASSARAKRSMAPLPVAERHQRIAGIKQDG